MTTSNLFGWDEFFRFSRGKKSARASEAHLQEVDDVGPRGLMIRDPYASEILNGQKIWEIRGRPTQIRGPVVVVKSGTGRAFGTANLVRVLGPLDAEDLMNASELPPLEREEIAANGLPYPKTYAYVFSNPKWFEKPIPYKHPSGAVTWVRLPDLDLAAVHYAASPRDVAQLRLV
ncbi:ASCH domain-containing protein [Rhizobium ruizarguesonis]